jgi:outer membrane protein TolC
VESLYWAAKVAVAGQRPSLALTGSASHETADGGDNAIAQAGVSHLFDISGRYSLQERKVLLDYEVGVLGLADLVNGTLSSAETLYWTTVLARANIDLYEELLRQREEDLRITREKFKQGLAPELDVIRARAQVEDNRSSLVEAQANYKDGLSSMKALAGGLDVEPCADCLQVPENTLSVTEERGLQDRPDLKGLVLSQERARVARDLSSKGMVPDLTGNILWTVQSDQTVSTPAEGELLASLSLSIPLSDGGKTKSETRQAEKLVLAAGRALDAGKDKASQEFELASTRWDKAVALERSRNEQVSQAKEEMRITQLRYREGLGAQIDLLIAQVGLQQARTGYLEAVKEMHLALVDLRSSRGDYGNEFSPEVAPGKF